jgi:hypothetical protein
MVTPIIEVLAANTAAIDAWVRDYSVWGTVTTTSTSGPVIDMLREPEEEEYDDEEVDTELSFMEQLAECIDAYNEEHVGGEYRRWLQADGSSIALHEMTGHHLANALRFCRKKVAEGVDLSAWVTYFEEEIARRRGEWGADWAHRILTDQCY